MLFFINSLACINLLTGDFLSTILTLLKNMLHIYFHIAKNKNKNWWSHNYHWLLLIHTIKFNHLNRDWRSFATSYICYPYALIYVPSMLAFSKISFYFWLVYTVIFGDLGEMLHQKSNLQDSLCFHSTTHLSTFAVITFASFNPISLLYMAGIAHIL